MKAQGIDWRTRALNDHFKGRWVKVQGWLLLGAPMSYCSLLNVNTAAEKIFCADFSGITSPRSQGCR
jgi:hypothetical protein